MLFDARGTTPYHLHLTYPIDEIDVERKKDWEKEQAKEESRKEKGASSKEPRPNWSPAKQGLVSLFKKRPLGRGQKLHIVAEDTAQLIDVLDPLGF